MTPNASYRDGGVNERAVMRDADAAWEDYEEVDGQSTAAVGKDAAALTAEKGDIVAAVVGSAAFVGSD